MKKTILIVDDEALLRNAMRLLLEMEGFRVIAGSNYDEGYTLAHAFTCNHSFIDINLPNSKSGVELAKKFREQNLCPVTLITGSVGTDRYIDGFPVLRKPFGVDAMLAAINASDTCTGNGTPPNPAP